MTVQERFRRRLATDGPDDGQILILVLGYVIVAFAFVVVAVDITAVHLARTQLLDAADAAALDAADAVDPVTVYRDGVPGAVPLSTATVRGAAAAYLSSYALPSRVSAVQLTRDTGCPDGQTAVVELTARVKLPLLGPVVQAWSGGITVTVRSQARADIDP
jgi:Putative Flp pilus-assembly TadE/G-like